MASQFVSPSLLVSRLASPTLIYVTLDSNPRRYIETSKQVITTISQGSPFGNLYQNSKRWKIFYRSYTLSNECDNVVKIWKYSLKNYFGNLCINMTKTVWKATHPFIADKRYTEGNSIILNEHDIVNDSSKVADICNEFFTRVAPDIGFNDGHFCWWCHTSVQRSSQSTENSTRIREDW